MKNKNVHSVCKASVTGSSDECIPETRRETWFGSCSFKDSVAKLHGVTSGPHRRKWPGLIATAFRFLPGILAAGLAFKSDANAQNVTVSGDNGTLTGGCSAITPIPKNLRHLDCHGLVRR